MKYSLGLLLLYAATCAANNIYLVNKTASNINITYINCRIFETWDGETRTQNDVNCEPEKQTLTIPAKLNILSPFTSAPDTPKTPGSFDYLSSYITEISSPTNSFKPLLTPNTPMDYVDRCNVTPQKDDCSFVNYFPISPFPSTQDLAIIFDDFGIEGFINASIARYGR